MGLHTGVFLSGLVLIAPLMALLGTFSPLCISLLERAQYSPHRVTGIIFGTSTLGGVVFTLLAGLLVIPTYGLTLTCQGLGGILLVATTLFAWRELYRRRGV
jgi:predicted membrane-bound spermidine synthase